MSLLDKSEAATFHTNSSNDTPREPVEPVEGTGTSGSWFSNIFPVGGFLGTIFSIAATVIGAGLLSLPSSFKDVGMLMSIMYLILVSLESVYTMRLLAILAERTGIYSLEGLSALYLNTAASIVLGIIRIIFCFGACVAYVISVGNLMQTIIENSSNAPEFLRTDWGEKMLQTIFWLLFMLSVVIPRQINTLRYISAAGVGFIVLFVVVIVIHACMNGLQEHPRPEVQIVGTGNNALNGVGVFIFSFVNQFNCLEVYQEMNPRTKSVRNYTICAIISITICCVVYVLGGAFGYVDFGPNASKSLLQLYDPISEPQIFVSYIGVLIKLCASYGLLFVGCRNSLYHFIGWDPETVAFWKHLLTVSAISLLILVCGLFIPNVNTVFGFVGGLCGGSISFLYPAYLTMYSGNWNVRSVGWGNYIATYVVLAAGVFAVVVGTGSTIYTVV